jgi:hypothetical protein
VLLHHDAELHLRRRHRLRDNLVVEDEVEGDVPSGFRGVAVGVVLN